MAQNQPYAQYPYFAQPQNIYQQLGKPQPQPHLQSAYQQQQQQLVHVPQQQPQYQYAYQQQQQQQQQPQPIQNVQRVPSAQEFQSPSFSSSPAFTPQPQQQVYQYSPQGVQTPSIASTSYQQRPPSQNNSRIPTSSFPNPASGHPIQNVLPRQLGNNQAAGQLVPASQSLAIRGSSPAMPPGPPISPSAMFAQQVQGQRQPPPAPLGTANRNSVGAPVQKQVMPPPQTQTQSQLQLSLPQQQAQLQIQSQPEAQPPPLPPRNQPQQQLQQSQSTPTKPATQRRPLPSPKAQRSFPSVNTSFPSGNTPIGVTTTSSSISNASPTRSGPALAQTASQPNSPNKTSAPSSPTKTSRPLPTPGGNGGASSGASLGGPSTSPGKEGFAGIGARRNASHVVGLPISSEIASQAANINIFSLRELRLPEDSTPEDPTNQSRTEDADDALRRSRASPPKFQSDTASTSSSSVKTASPSTSSINTPPSLTSTSSKQSKAGPSSFTHNPTPTSTSPTKKMVPAWKRSIPDYPQPVFGYAAGMVPDPWVAPAKQQPANTAIATVTPPKKPTSDKRTHAEMRSLVEREHVERQLNAAMAQAHAQAHTQKRIAGMPVSNTSYSAYAMYSRSNPNLHQQKQSAHVPSAAYDDGDEEDEDEDDDDEEEEEESSEDEEVVEAEREVRRRKNGKKPSPVVTGKKDKKKKDVKEKKVQKKPKPNSQSTSLPPKKRTSSRPPVISSTSEDDTEATEMTLEETEEEEYRRSNTRHAKSSSASSSRFKAKVEQEKQILRKKRSYQQDFVEEYDDVNTSRKREAIPIRRREPSPPVQRQSYPQRPVVISAFRRGSPSPDRQYSGFEYGGRSNSPSPPPSHRTSRRISPTRIGLLKDAQRKTIKLRGVDDDDDVFIDKERERREEAERWKKDERYRSMERERGRNDPYADRNRYVDERNASGYRKHEEDDNHYERARQEERDARYTSARNGRGRHSVGGVNHLPQPPSLTRRRDTEERDDQWSKNGRRDERDSRMFNLGRAESPSRSVRDSGFAAGYRNRPASPTRNFPQHQSSRNNPPNSTSVSSLRNQPVSSTSGRLIDDRGTAGLVTKFTAVTIQDRERSNGYVEQGEWPLDLPRLPRTPGEKSNTSGSGYFDIPPNRDVYSNSGSGHRPSTEFARMSGRSPTEGPYDSGYGNSSRSVRKESHSPQHYNNLQMNLDDSPPRSLSPAISQAPNSYGRNDERPQHKRVQSHPQTMPQRRSAYTNGSAPGPEPLSPVKPRPQSQVYAHQAHSSQPPSPRPQLINPLDHANMNTSNINNGTPKIQTISIESPAPMGGREKRADLNRMMSDPEDEGFTTPVPRSNRRDGGNRRRNMNSSQGSTTQVSSQRGPMIQIDEPRGSIVQVESPRGPAIQVESPRGPMMQVDSPRGPVVNIDLPQSPMINVESSPPHNSAYSSPNVQVYNVPGISVAGPEFDDDHDHERNSGPPPHHQQKQNYTRPNRGGLICGGCDGPIIGRIVSAMGARWHPQCFRCTVCNELLEHVSSYEHEGRPYCHLDYHENFAPRCFSCKTSIVEERFISLDDPALGKRTYHEQHFFCAECGDPFLAPSLNHPSRTGELNVQGDGEFESDDVGFTVYKGHPYCEACHVRLRLPKCKKCKKSIRDHEQAVEALGGKWCWGCFVCASCERPFENPSFFQRGDKPFCERCFDIMLRNEV